MCLFSVMDSEKIFHSTLGSILDDFPKRQTWTAKLALHQEGNLRNSSCNIIVATPLAGFDYFNHPTL